MSLLNYMEKDIARRIKIVEFIYSKSTCSISELQSFFQVSLPTLRSDFVKIQQQLDDLIITSQWTAKAMTITFKSNTSLLQITNVLYNDSKFIRILYRLLQEPSLSIVKIQQLEFLSESAAAKTYHQVQQFLKERGIFISERRYRLLLTCLYAKVDEKLRSIDPFYWQKAKVLFDKLEDKELMFFDSFSKDLVIMTIYLALTRKDISFLNLDPLQFQYLMDSPIYKKALTFYKQSLYKETATNEAIMTTLIFMQFVNYKEMTYANLCHRQYFLKLTAQHVSVQQLYLQLMTLSSKEIIDEVSFQRLFMKALFNAWVGLEVFTTHYLIDTTDYQYLTFFRTFERWKKIGDYPITLQNANIAECFYWYQHLMTTPLPYTCQIVCTNQNQFTFFYHYLEKYLSHSQFKINQHALYSMEEVPEVMFSSPYLIICEHSLYEEKTKSNNIFSFSIDNIVHDIEHMIQQLFQLANKENK